MRQTKDETDRYAGTRDRQTGTRVPEMRQTCTRVPETDMHRGARDVMTDMDTANQLSATIRVDL